jgi:hypothetical protein
MRMQRGNRRGYVHEHGGRHLEQQGHGIPRSPKRKRLTELGLGGAYTERFHITRAIE